jgi:sec-independent protein translocase protein TatA
MLGFVLLFFDIGGGEIILIMVVVLVLFGGDKLPELARGLGKGIRDFKDASEGVKREITNQIDNFEAKKAAEAAEKSPGEENKSEAETTKPTVTPASNTMPVAEIGSAAVIEPVAGSETGHARETPIEPLVDEAGKTEHHQIK